MKKILALALAAAMSLTLVACGGSKTPAASGSASSGGSSSAETVDFPGNKQVSLIVPYSAGGASDTVARIYASELEQSLGTSIVVSNVTGASGAIGLEQVRNSNPDGYTIAYMPVESTMLKALGFTDLSTDDFRFIGRAMTIPAAVTVRADAPWDTFEDFVNYAKEHPGEIQVGNSGTGSIWHIAAASIEKECGVQFTHVPFDGAAPAVAALLGGNIQAVTVSPSEVKNNVDSGDFKVLCVLGESRSSVVPDVPTAQELGIDITIQGWGGFAVPKDTPQAVIDILEKASETAINSDSVKKTLADRGYEHAYLSGSDMDQKASEELAYYSELIPELGIA
ncbi:tripartite tricarboxylate transporter substrate binding protein [Colidextribacter sp. 210702-DFI.3.9]|uniref:Tripartite tricarboxylate transporter substrate binding protein n=1 Tax=Flintibacter faecis TaxID=2763047 RepID=A0A8J6M4G8_9FIRM|nr:tripartite tricarboxylate transporter substrate binding protein [Flintibacter faecis]MBC5716747.1 tripartite tricarboxylate transporter substrate binding protein [Flintibacter faecis]MCB6500544.1 tripartite tricarboxylate transporter substrate binding protein [Colidextribacter sp. 210702-DFI.3.9]MCG4469232.1 tripartite tricarboxylate transporter substrate binding protein [Lawsonibacter sp. DFI.6.74]MCG4772884.1 tripartite tricarboxylate transporter substrate binding protein [Lawsonibacter sp